MAVSLGIHKAPLRAFYRGFGLLEWRNQWRTCRMTRTLGLYGIINTRNQIGTPFRLRCCLAMAQDLLFCVCKVYIPEKNNTEAREHDA